MIEIRPEQKADYHAISTVNDLAFERKEEGKVIEQLRQMDSFIPELSLVALIDGSIVGHILFTPVSIKAEKTITPALILGPMAVLPEFQQQGIGSDLVKHGLAASLALNHGIVLVVGHPTYYPRFGFKRAKVYGLKLTFSVPDEAFMVFELKEKALKGVSGTVILPAAFDNV